MELTFLNFAAGIPVCFGIAYNFNDKFAPEAGKQETFPACALRFSRVLPYCLLRVSERNTATSGFSDYAQISRRQSLLFLAKMIST